VILAPESLLAMRHDAYGQFLNYDRHPMRSDWLHWLQSAALLASVDL
jgi:hypothetical protein